MRVFTSEVSVGTIRCFLHMCEVCVCSLTERITFQSAPSPQEFNEGDDADIVCDVVSSPSPSIIWKHKGSKIQSAKDGELFLIKTMQFLCLLSHFHLLSSPRLPGHTAPPCQCFLPSHAFQSICYTLRHLLLLPIIHEQSHES